MTNPLNALIVVRPNGRYDVVFNDEIIVRSSRDPECDLARVLLARGIRGTITLRHGSGKLRTSINIEKAARLTVREDRSTGPRFVKWRPMPQIAHERCEGRSPTGESNSLSGEPLGQRRAAL